MREVQRGKINQPCESIDIPEMTSERAVRSPRTPKGVVTQVQLCEASQPLKAALCQAICSPRTLLAAYFQLVVSRLGSKCKPVLIGVFSSIEVILG